MTLLPGLAAHMKAKHTANVNGREGSNRLGAIGVVWNSYDKDGNNILGSVAVSHSVPRYKDPNIQHRYRDYRSAMLGLPNDFVQSTKSLVTKRLASGSGESLATDSEDWNRVGNCVEWDPKTLKAMIEIAARQRISNPHLRLYTQVKVVKLNGGDLGCCRTCQELIKYLSRQYGTVTIRDANN